MVLDELKEAGRLDALPRVLTKGRSFGIRVAIGFQDICGLQNTYGEKLASEITAMCGNISILRLNSHPTAEWAARLIGEAEMRETTRSTTTGWQSSSETANEHIVKREAVLASELMTLPLPDGKVFWGYHIVPALGTFKAPIRYDEFLSKRPKPTASNHEPRDGSEQYLRPWRDDDRARLTGTLAQATQGEAGTPVPVPPVAGVGSGAGDDAVAGAVGAGGGQSPPAASVAGEETQPTPLSQIKRVTRTRLP